MAPKKIQFPPGFEPGIQDSKSWVLNHYTTGTSARVTEQRLYFREKIRLVRRWIKICCHGGPNQDKRLISAHAGILQGGIRGGSPIFQYAANSLDFPQIRRLTCNQKIAPLIRARARRAAGARWRRRPQTRPRPPRAHAWTASRGRARAQAPRTRVWGALFAPRPLPQRILPFLFRGLPWTAVADVVGPVASPHGRK